jgi:hypothetical protein
VTAGIIDTQSNKLNMTGGKIAGSEITIKSMEVNIEGKKEVKTTKKVEHGFFSKTTEYTKTTIFKNAVIESKNISITGERSLQLGSTDIHSENIHLSSQDVTFIPLSGDNIHEYDHSNLIHSHTRSENNSVESISHLNSKTIVLEGEHVNLYGVTPVGEKVEIHSKDITGSRSILNSTYDEKETGISIQLRLSNNIIDSSHSVIDMTTGISNLASEILNEQILQSQFNPTLTIKIGEKSTHLSQDYLGEGGIIAGELILDSEKIAFSNNYGLNAKNTHINSKSFSASGAELTMDYESHDKHLILNKGLFSSDIGFSAGKEKTHQTYYIGGDLQSDDLYFNVENANFYGQYFQVNHLSGQIGTLKSEAGLNQFYHNSYHGSIFYNGGFSWDKQYERSQNVNSNSPFSLVNSPSSEDFFVTHLNLTGQSPGGIHYQYYHNTPVPVFDIKNSTHMDGSWRDVLLIGNPSQIFSSIHYNFSHENYSGLQRDQLQVLHASHKNYHISLPIYHFEAGQKLWEKLRYFMGTNLNHDEVKPSIAPEFKNTLSLYESKQKINNLIEFDEIEIDLPFEIGKELLHSSRELSRARYNLIEIFNENKFCFSDMYKTYWEDILYKASPFCRSIFNSFSSSIDVDPSFLQLPVDVVLNKTPFSLPKINFLKYGGYGLFGASSGLGLYSIYKSDNRLEETARIGFLAITGSAGWELGELIAGTVCAVNAPFCAGGIAIAGAIGVNVMADYDWHHIKEKIEHNIEIDRELPIRFVDTFSFFKPKSIIDPSLEVHKIRKTF